VTPKHDSRRGGGLRLLSYARVSAVRGREGPGFISEADQFSRNRNYTKTYGHRIVDEGSDLDVSGGKMTRPTFDRFLAKIQAGEADGIIVAKLDRCARSNVGALAAVETIEDAGGTLISVAEQLDASTGAGRFLRSILFAAAEWERERIGEAWKVARSSAVERGIHVAPYVPPGYVRGERTNDPKTDRRLSPHPVHAETMREAFKMAARGARDSEIARYLNERQLLSYSIKRGERPTHWQPSRIPRLLANRAYLGEARGGKGDIPTNAEAHEPLVDEATFMLANQPRGARQDPRRPNMHATAPPSILSGIVRCAGCSFAMKPQEAGKTSPALYRCIKSSVHGVCPSPSVVTKTKVEDFVIEQFLAEADTVFAAAGVEDDDEWTRLNAEAGAAEQAYRRALTNVELRQQIGDRDHDELIASLHRDWQDKLRQADAARPNVVPMMLPEGVSLRELVEQLRAEGENEKLRGLLAAGIEAVFVRPARSRAHNLPVGDRAKIVWRGTESVELPRRGRRFEPRAYAW
jgi:DNA invertase Pin-like site-specific DNA recombinase